MSKIIDAISRINTECFTRDDPYSSKEYLAYIFSHGSEYRTVRVNSEIVGYIIFQELDTHIESLRRALTKSARGMGLGLKLSKMLTKIARERDKSIYTYVSKTNLPSLNSNIKVGYRIEDISADWVYIRYRP